MFGKEISMVGVYNQKVLLLEMWYKGSDTKLLVIIFREWNLYWMWPWRQPTETRFRDFIQGVVTHFKLVAIIIATDLSHLKATALSGDSWGHSLTHRKLWVKRKHKAEWRKKACRSGGMLCEGSQPRRGIVSSRMMIFHDSPHCITGPLCRESL